MTTMSHSSYMFTSDWFSHNIPIWMNVLSEFRDKSVKALEIGSYQGRSAVWLLENILTHPDATLTCVDTFEGSAEHTFDQKVGIWDMFQNNVITNFGPKVNVLRGKSGDIMRTFPADEVFDIVYIDGCHYSANVMEDAVLTFPLLRVGGILIFDDYLGGEPGERHLPFNPKTGIDGFLAAYAPYINTIYSGYQHIVKKTGHMA